MSSDTAFYSFDPTELDQVRSSKAWMQDPKYFKRVHVSACAAMKMMQHAVSGVEKGLQSQGGKPVEVMGLLLGRPSTTDKTSLIVTDAFALPIEGAETKVVADDQEVMNFMIELSSSLEATRSERFMGWYHSHPFDVEVHSHCFLSSTDVSTQLQWQRSEDPHGNAWVGIVIDPLRSLAKGRPEFGAFRVFPPEYSSPNPNMTPDGSIVTDSSRVEKWGNAWNRYMSLEISYFMSSMSSNVLTTISENYLWKNALSTTPTQDREYRDRFPERIHGATEKLESNDKSGSANLLATSLRSAASSGGASKFNAPATEEIKTMSSLDKVSRAVCEISVEQCQAQVSQVAKVTLFGR